MGLACSNKRKINLVLQEQGKQEDSKLPFPTSFKQEILHQRDSDIENLLKLIELIDTQDAYSKFLLQNLNELIIRRSNILFLSHKQISAINDHLSYCVMIIRGLQGNEEFEHYFPILSYSLYDMCSRLEVYLRKQSNESTRYCSLQRIT
ncbi:unnamed protein product (macronuclear) [Paramecium tetraurelia]|uniref:Uncharacterized protein n=1 Tax=Paramecium tetraurelia TaxID=5888 RepID=A0BV92_PARTE|nr:uncharacterized protein GSPATT00005705001 [Paramecium tetraurelia]CAK62459.1 unnamed protein product [Paramecium tetraurelia]|eukprot:XP_001429857.1 hypothetical protein (macronuclear) [Paramecium tetraurelia strain d4-2]